MLFSYLSHFSRFRTALNLPRNLAHSVFVIVRKITGKIICKHKNKINTWQITENSANPLNMHSRQKAFTCLNVIQILFTFDLNWKVLHNLFICFLHLGMQSTLTAQICIANVSQQCHNYKMLVSNETHTGCAIVKVAWKIE